MVEKGKMIRVVYMSRSHGRTTVTGPATRTRYGYRKKGDQFDVYEADIRARPNLFVPLAEIAEEMKRKAKFYQEIADQFEDPAQPVSVPEPVEPEYVPEPIEGLGEPAEGIRGARLGSLDYAKPINKKHISILADNGVVTVQDVLVIGQRMTTFTGIGKKIAGRIIDWCKELISEEE